ncbi:MAG: DUF4912 domain-containing protein [Acidobacteria bacterium]|nr:DUF4912 domain-containing protein [Acidobacteriota bacterium]
MNDQETKKELSENEQLKKDTNVREFVLDDFKTNSISSAQIIKKIPTIDEKEYDIPVLEDAPQILVDDDLTEMEDELLEIENPIFKELSEPKLPELPKENRARLQMQSPTKLNFYWSIKTNPFKALSRAFGGKTGSYSLVAKLVNQTNAGEEFFPVEAEGSWWFDVDADSTYRAEIGFYAPNRPFVRVMFSNTVETPRKNPSPRRAESENWEVSANQFAQVLDASGFPQDAFEVALAGDDFEFSETATQNAFSQFIGRQETNFAGDEIRFALLALASGYALENLRGQIGASLFAVLQGNPEKAKAENALASLQENFGVFSGEIEEEFLSPTVFGASLINFPRTSKRKRFLPKFAPVSSLRSVVNG